MGTETAASSGSIEKLQAHFGGALVRPEDDVYDEFRGVFNAMIDRRPALIARCTGVADVIAAIRFARENELAIAVLGGGHSVIGYGVCDEGLVVDLRPMKGIWVDPNRQVARAQAGVTWGEFDRETQVHGLAVTGGRVSTTGIAGLALGSGSGWLERKFGLTPDNLLSAELVTADGKVVRASADENDDLFWGLRGGGGNFGVVTSFEFSLHLVGPLLLAGMVMHTAERAPELLRFYREFMEQAPDEVLGALAFITAPPAPFVPPDLQGQPAVAIIMAYAGGVEDGEHELQRLREFGPPEVELVAPMPYTGLQTLLNEANPSGLHNYWKAENFVELSDEAIDVMVARAAQVRSPHTEFLLIPCGGALARVEDDATALGGRDAMWQYHALSLWASPAESEQHIGWARETAEALRPFTKAGIYLNYTSDEGEDRVRSAYGPKYDRLVALKNKYDPTNVFCNNQNIKPTV